MPCPQAGQQVIGTRGCPASCSTYKKYVPEWKKRSPGCEEVLFSPLKHFQHLRSPWFTVQPSWLACLAQCPGSQAAPQALRGVSYQDPSFLEKLLLQTPSYTGGGTKHCLPTRRQDECWRDFWGTQLSSTSSTGGRGHRARGNCRPPDSEVSASHSSHFIINDLHIFRRCLSFLINSSSYWRFYLVLFFFNIGMNPKSYSCFL